MFRNKLSDEFIGDSFSWCIKNDILPNTRYTLNGKDKNKVYSESEIKELFSNLVDQLFDSEVFVEQLKKNIMFDVPIDAVKDEAKKDSNISEALYRDVQGVVHRGVSINDLFYALISDILLILKFKEQNLKDVLENRFQNQLLTKNEYVSLKIFRVFVYKVLKNAINGLQNNKNNVLKINGEWNDCAYVDGKLIDLLNHGSASGIYNRIRYIITFNKSSDKYSKVGNSKGYDVVKQTLMVELGKLSISRQIVFTRLLNYVSRLINIDDNHLYSYLVVKTEYNLNNLIWNLVYSAVAESGIKRLYYDDHNFMKYLHKMKSKGMKVLRLFRILVYDGRSYEGNENDYQSIKAELDIQKCYEGKNIDYYGPSFAKLLYKTKGIASFESKIYEI